MNLTCDVVIVGSGAGGSVLAAGLAQAGHKVVILEAGPHRTRADFTLHEKDSLPSLYQEGGARATDDLAISVLQGRSVGGSTTVNWTSCFRTPTRILDHWRLVHGLEALTDESLAPHFDVVEARLNISEWPLASANANNRVLLDGCAALGWEVGPMRRNQRGCANSGYCGQGCPVDGKQAMHLTYLPDALEAGATLIADCTVERVVVEGGRAVGVVARRQSQGSPLPDGEEVQVRARVVCLCGGALNTPALLLRSGLAANGLVGKRTFLHPVVAVLGKYSRDVHPWYGAPQSAHSHQFFDRGPQKVGFFLEAAPLHPLLSAIALKQLGPAHATQMADLRSTSALLALHVDGLLPGDEGGTVRVTSDGRMKLSYPVTAPLIEAFRASHEVLAQVHLAAGAERAATTHLDPLVFRSEADLRSLDQRPYGALEHSIFSAHQMGGCSMGADADRAPVAPDHRFRGVEQLFVVDGSVLPTSLGVNPSETIYALAHRARAFVAEAV